MDKISRQKFLDIKIGDSLWYLDPGGSRCEGLVSGWRNVDGLPALLCGQHGDRVVPLAQVLSRTRGSGTKEWPVDKDKDKDKPRAKSLM